MLSASIGKVLVKVNRDSQLALFCVLVFVYLLMSLAYFGSSAKAASTVDASLYIPVRCSLQLSLNCITGLVFWEDWRVIDATVAYGMVHVLILLGVYQCSSFDFGTWYSYREVRRNTKASAAAPSVRVVVVARARADAGPA